ncbi:MAG: LysM peptidoglycan-binding domain-containing protein, partial [Pseudomonadota bacterium]
ADPIPEPSADEPEDPAQPSVPASSVLAAVDPAGNDAVVNAPAPDPIRRGDASSTGITTPEPVVRGTAPRIGGTPSGTASPRPGPSGLPVQDGSSPSTADRDERIARHDAAVPATALPGADRKADPGAPSFDLVRVSPDGQTVIAGRAMPDQVVEILIGGQLVEEVRADRNGQFVSVLFANAATEPRSLELRTLVPNEPEPADTTVPAVTEDAERAVDLSDGDPAPLTTNPEAPRGTEVPENAVTPDIALSGPAPKTPGSDDGPEPVVGGQADPAIAGTPLSLAAAEAPSLSGPGASSQAHQTARSGSRYAVSAPVIILPAAQDTDVPTLVELDRRDLKLLQPSDRDIRGVVLDSITYGETGDVILSGRGIPPRAIRIYANAVPVGIARVGQDGVWTYALPEAGANDIKLFRMDEIDDAGGVTSRVEAPFQYRRFSPQVLRERRVVVQRGDALWRIAEQYYGEGIRYSMIYGANTELIRDPDLIYPGQVFSIPELVDAN